MLFGILLAALYHVASPPLCLYASMPLHLYASLSLYELVPPQPTRRSCAARLGSLGRVVPTHHATAALPPSGLSKPPKGELTEKCSAKPLGHNHRAPHYGRILL